MPSASDLLSNFVNLRYNGEQEIFFDTEIKPNEVKVRFNIDKNRKIRLISDNQTISEGNNAFDSELEKQNTYEVVVEEPEPTPPPEPPPRARQSQTQNEPNNDEKRVFLSYLGETKKFKPDTLTASKIKNRFNIDSNLKIRLINDDYIINEDDEGNFDSTVTDGEFDIEIVEEESEDSTSMQRNIPQESSSRQIKLEIPKYEENEQKTDIKSITLNDNTTNLNLSNIRCIDKFHHEYKNVTIINKKTGELTKYAPKIKMPVANGDVFTVIYSSKQLNASNSNNHETIIVDDDDKILIKNLSSANRIVLWYMIKLILLLFKDNIKSDINLNSNGNNNKYSHILTTKSLKPLLYQLILSMNNYIKNHSIKGDINSISDDMIKLLLNKNILLLNKTYNEIKEFIDLLCEYIKQNEINEKNVELIYNLQNKITNYQCDNDNVNQNVKIDINNFDFKKKIYPIELQELTKQRKYLNEYIQNIQKHFSFKKDIDVIKNLLTVLSDFTDIIDIELSTNNQLKMIFDQENIKNSAEDMGDNTNPQNIESSSSAISIINDDNDMKHKNDDNKDIDDVMNRIKANYFTWKTLYKINKNDNNQKQQKYSFDKFVTDIYSIQSIVEIAFYECEDILTPSGDDGNTEITSSVTIS